jgi:hypothetical protein
MILRFICVICVIIVVVVVDGNALWNCCRNKFSHPTNLTVIGITPGRTPCRLVFLFLFIRPLPLA